MAHFCMKYTPMQKKKETDILTVSFFSLGVTVILHNFNKNSYTLKLMDAGVLPVLQIHFSSREKEMKV